MVIEDKYVKPHGNVLRDTRTGLTKFRAAVADPSNAGTMMVMAAGYAALSQSGQMFSDVLLVTGSLYFWWLMRHTYKAPLKLAAFSKKKDKNERSKKASGIMFLGNEKKTGEELWLSGKDIGTHALYLGTTGAGKTEGLISMAANSLSWGSGFIYIDGKADNSLWGKLYALSRRFGRDDDIFVLNYLTGNSDLGSVSNTINPFTSGSSSYLTNLLVSLMDESKGENAMWKGRAVALLGALMPILTYRRETLGMPLDVKVILDSISLQSVIRLSRDVSVPENIRMALTTTYLDTLPGYIAAAFADDGSEAPPGPNDPPRDMSTVSQQHNFLSMQFTRALQSLSGDYWYIFGNQVADVVMQDIVLNRRILVVLIPSLEKSADEAANLGKIVTASIKGMMGATLGASVEGDWSGVIDNKLSNSSSPFLTIFDEVGYYATQGMAVMAAQARSLGFSLVFASQDIPSMELRVKEEAKSITANCNLKIFGKLEESLDTQNFFEKTVGQTLVSETSGMSKVNGSSNYSDGANATITSRAKAGWSDLRDQVEGEVHLTWQSKVIAGKLFYANPPRVKAMRVHKLLGLRQPEPVSASDASSIRSLVKNLRNPSWTAASVMTPVEESEDLAVIMQGFKLSIDQKKPLRDCGAMAIAALAAAHAPPVEPELEIEEQEEGAIGDPEIDDMVELEGGEATYMDEDAAATLEPADEPLEIEETELLQLPSPDHDVDELLDGLMVPRKRSIETEVAVEAMPMPVASIFHPAMSVEVEHILAQAAARMASSIEQQEVPLAAQ